MRNHVVQLAKEDIKQKKHELIELVVSDMNKRDHFIDSSRSVVNEVKAIQLAA